MANARVLITGAGGTLGGALKRKLEKRFATLLTPNRHDLNLADLMSVQRYFDRERPDIIFHLASTVYGLAGNSKNQLSSLASNTLINNNLFDVIGASPQVRRIVFAGTVASYG